MKTQIHTHGSLQSAAKLVLVFNLALAHAGSASFSSGPLRPKCVDPLETWLPTWGKFESLPLASRAELAAEGPISADEAHWWTVAADIFAPVSKDTTAEKIRYHSSAELLAATKNGEIPEALKNDEFLKECRVVGRSVLYILENECHFSRKDKRFDEDLSIGLMLSNITKYQTKGANDETLAKTYQTNHKQYFDELSLLKAPKGYTDACDSLLKEYSNSVREWIILAKGREDKRQLEQAQQQRLAGLAAQRMDEQRQQEKAVADSKLASQRAEDVARMQATKDAMTAAGQQRSEKLKQVLESQDYKRWQAAIQVEEGVRLIEAGQKALEHDDAVSRVSGVTDLAARRAAGEQVTAGRLLVERSFQSYKELRGTAVSPEDVQAGVDPARDYR